MAKNIFGQEIAELVGKKERGDHLYGDTYFIGWCSIGREQQGFECPSCHGYCEETECTEDEILSDLNCGRTYACCCVAFKCKLCGKRWVGKANAPEME